MSERATVVGIDGPNGVGKTAVARALAHELGCPWLSIGMVYRAVAASGASRDTPVGLDCAAAGDGTLDPLCRVGDRVFAEEDLRGSALAARAAEVGADAGWQGVVNRALRAFATRSLVVEGRATREIFPDALLHVYLWADAEQRRRRAAAVHGGAVDHDRDRRDAGRAAEPLRVRTGVTVWNSTRFAMPDTVRGLVRRVRLAGGAEPVLVAAPGPLLAAAGGAGTEVRAAGLRVRLVAAGASADLALTLPATTGPLDWEALLAAHVTVQLAGNDLVTVGGVHAAGRPTASQRVLQAAPWPLNAWLRTAWLRGHGHYAVSRDVPMAEADGDDDDRIGGARWIALPGACVEVDAEPAPTVDATGDAAVLAELQRAATGAARARVAVPASADPRMPLWAVAAVPGVQLEADVDWAVPR